MTNQILFVIPLCLLTCVDLGRSILHVLSVRAWTLYSRWSQVVGVVPGIGRCSHYVERELKFSGRKVLKCF